MQGKIKFSGSQTYKNLQAAFAGESQASMKYRYYSSQAKKDGFVWLSKVFDESSLSEKEHAEIWFKIMKNDGALNGAIPDTTTNLKGCS